MHYECIFKGKCVAYFFSQKVGAIVVKFLSKLGHPQHPMRQPLSILKYTADSSIEARRNRGVISQCLDPHADSSSHMERSI